MAQIIDFDGARARTYIERAVEGFLKDPPDSDYQAGYLAALLAVWEEAIGSKGDARHEAASRLLKRTVKADP